YLESDSRFYSINRSPKHFCRGCVKLGCFIFCIINGSATARLPCTDTRHPRFLRFDIRASLAEVPRLHCGYPRGLEKIIGIGTAKFGRSCDAMHWPSGTEV